MAETTERDIEELLAAGTAGIAPPLITGIPWYHPPEFAEIYTQKELDRTYRYIYDYLSSIGIDNKLLNEDIVTDALISGRIDEPDMLRVHVGIQGDLIDVLNAKLFLSVADDTESITRSTGKLLENIYTMEEAIYGIPIDEAYSRTPEMRSTEFRTRGNLTMFDHNRVLFNETKYILQELKNAINEPDMPTRKVLKMLKEGKFNHLPDIDEIVAVLGNEVVKFISDIKIEELARMTFLPETAYVNPLIEGLTEISGDMAASKLSSYELSEGISLLERADEILLEQGFDSQFTDNPLSLFASDDELLEIGVKPDTKTPFRDLYFASKKLLKEGIEEFIDSKGPSIDNLKGLGPISKRTEGMRKLSYIFNTYNPVGAINVSTPRRGIIWNVLENYGGMTIQSPKPPHVLLDDELTFLTNELGVPGKILDRNTAFPEVSYNYERFGKNQTDAEIAKIEEYEELIRQPRRVLFAQGKWNKKLSGKSPLDTLEFFGDGWHTLPTEKLVNRLLEYQNELGNDLQFVLRDIKSGTIQPIPLKSWLSYLYQKDEVKELKGINSFIFQARLNKSPIAIHLADAAGDIIQGKNPVARNLINRLKDEDFNLITEDMYGWTGMEDMKPSEIEEMKIGLAGKGEAKLVSSKTPSWKRKKPKKSLEVPLGVDISKQASVNVEEPRKKRTVMEHIRDLFRGTQGRQGLEIAEETIKSNPKFFSKVLNVLAKLDVGEEVIRRTLERVGTKYAATSVTGPVAAGLAVYETAVLLADVANASIRAADKDVDFWDNFGNVDDKYSITYKLTKPFYESVFKGISNLSELSNEDNQVESYSMVDNR